MHHPPSPSLQDFQCPPSPCRGTQHSHPAVQTTELLLRKCLVEVSNDAMDLQGEIDGRLRVIAPSTVHVGDGNVDVPYHRPENKDVGSLHHCGYNVS